MGCHQLAQIVTLKASQETLMVNQERDRLEWMRDCLLQQKRHHLRLLQLSADKMAAELKELRLNERFESLTLCMSMRTAFYNDLIFDTTDRGRRTNSLATAAEEELEPLRSTYDNEDLKWYPRLDAVAPPGGGHPQPLLSRRDSPCDPTGVLLATNPQRLILKKEKQFVAIGGARPNLALLSEAGSYQGFRVREAKFADLQDEIAQLQAALRELEESWASQVQPDGTFESSLKRRRIS
ncbi:hypothetical protein C8F04DRAFT_1174140 [Mycena alexandri]|uniref:Uncharacterized protein n=1 Tax=Mycena alexandri TaxID=1745969 RepID=A0AAD6TFN5_9AGAR|nr:hypothetical protein C8F04DRAFT_1174140 [Mycena alexandri]